MKKKSFMFDSLWCQFKWANLTSSKYIYIYIWKMLTIAGRAFAIKYKSTYVGNMLAFLHYYEGNYDRVAPIIGNKARSQTWNRSFVRTSIYSFAQLKPIYITLKINMFNHMCHLCCINI
jgi:hypothetical protein